MAGRIGSIDTGKYADIVAVSGETLKDTTELQRVKFVMKAGRVIRNDMPRAACNESFRRDDETTPFFGESVE